MIVLTWSSAFPEDAHPAVLEVCTATEPEIRALLPALPEIIELTTRTGNRVIPETGETGSSVSPGHLIWTVDPSRPEGVVPIAKSQLRSTLFHECHHQVRGWVKFGGPPRTSFMDGVISEGLVTVFERDFGGRKPAWGKYPKDAHLWVAELMKLPIHAPYRQWMFQHPDGRRWIGYRAGTYIADRAIVESGLSAAELVKTPTNEILRLAGFGEEP